MWQHWLPVEMMFLLKVCFPMIPTCSRGFVEGRCNDCYPTSPNLCCMVSLEEQNSWLSFIQPWQSGHINTFSIIATCVHALFSWWNRFFFPCNFKKKNPTRTHGYTSQRLRMFPTDGLQVTAEHSKKDNCLYINLFFGKSLMLLFFYFLYLG